MNAGPVAASRPAQRNERSSTPIMTPAILLSCLFCEIPPATPPPVPLEPLPSPQQLAWHELEYGMFCHFGVNTFLDQEWGDGQEDPDVFQPRDFDPQQWVRAAKDAGMRYLVFTAKHHDGFCLFPSSLTAHSVAASSWRDGKGDVVRDVAEACRTAGLMFGVYLSPWDRHEPAYSDPPAYDEYFKGQLRELLTRYGPVGEVWLDGAGGKGHVYDWEGYFSLVRELQPNALLAICGPDIRWVGNEDGLAPDTVWYVQERGGKPVWYPPECDVPIRKGHWFFHADSEDTVRSVDELLEIYYRSVGRGAGLLLNITPDRRGLLPEKDVSVVREMWRIIAETFRTNLAQDKPACADHVRGGDPAYGPDKAVDGLPDTYWTTDEDVTAAALEVDLGAPTRFNRSMIQEYLPLGQRVEAYAIDAWDGGEWRQVVAGTTVGHKRLDRFPDVTAARVRLTVEKAKACPAIRTFGVYCAPE